jgi:TP901 family phage tail tape measure protein
MANQGKLDFLLNFKTNIGGVAAKIGKEVKGLVKDGETKFGKLSNTMGSTMGSTDKLSQAFTALKSSSPFDLLQKGADRFGAAFGPSAQFIIQSFLSVGSVIALTAAKAWHAAAQIDKAMFLLRTTTSATTAQQMKLSGAIGDVTMELGLGQDQAGRMAVGLTKAGLATDEVAKAMKTLGKMNHATGLDTGMLVDVYATMHKQMGTSAKDIEMLNEHLFRTSRVTTITADKLSDSMGRITDGVITYFGNASKASGVSSETMIADMMSVAAMIEPLQENGLALMDTFMAAAFDTSHEAYGQIRVLAGGLGDEMQDALASGDMDKAFAYLLEGIKNFNDPLTDLNTVLEQTFKIPGGAKMVNILKQSEMGVKGLADQLKNVKDSTSLAEAAEHLELSKMLFQMWNRISAALEPVGQMLLSILEPILYVFTFIVEALGAVLKIFAPILAVVGKVVGWVLALVAAFIVGVTILVVIVKVLGFIGAAIAFIATGIAAAMVPLLWMVAIVLAIAAVFWAIDEALKAIFGVGIIEIFTEALKVVMGYVQRLVDAIMWALNGIKDIWNWFFGSDDKEVDITVNKTVKEKTEVMKKPSTAKREKEDFGSMMSRRRLNTPVIQSASGDGDQTEVVGDSGASWNYEQPRANGDMIKPAAVKDNSKELHKSMMDSNTSPQKSAQDAEAVELLKEIRDEGKKGNDSNERKAGTDFGMRHNK